MKYLTFTNSPNLLCLAALLLLALLDISNTAVAARKPSRPAARGPPPGRRGPPPSSNNRNSASRSRATPLDDFDEPSDDEVEDVFDVGYDIDEEDVEEDYVPPPPSSKGKRAPPSGGRRPPSGDRGPPPRSSRQRPSTSRRTPPRDDFDDFEEEDNGRRPSRSSGRSGSSRREAPPSRRGRPGEVVPYGRGRRPARPSAAETAASTLTKGWKTFTSVMPDPATIRETATQSIGAARETATSLSGSLYREVKGLTSSELEQVMLKATRPDDTPVKGKHVERLVGVTYQISPRYDIYDAVLRKLWKKMAEKDWRTTIKALYILHRYSADGAPEHSQALKARLRELRRTKDPKSKEKYFNSKQLLAGDTRVRFASFSGRICVDCYNELSYFAHPNATLIT